MALSLSNEEMLTAYSRVIAFRNFLDDLPEENDRFHCGLTGQEDRACERQAVRWSANAFLRV